MKAIAARSALALMAIFAVTGCPKKDDDTTEPTKTEDSNKDEDGAEDGKDEDGAEDGDKDPEPKASAKPAKLEPDTPKPASGRAASELDGGKEPASDYSGTALTAGRAKFTAPKDWKKSNTDGYTVFESADGKSRFGAKGSSSPDGDLEAAAKALGLTDCKWGTAGSITIGKDKLAADVADGTCKRGAGEVNAVYAALSDEGSIAMGSWDSGGDDKNVFEAFRSTTKVAGGKGNAIAACCAAIAQNAASAPPQFKGAYIAAAGACNAAKSNPNVAAGLAAARSALVGVQIPAACR